MVWRDFSSSLACELLRSVTVQACCHASPCNGQGSSAQLAGSGERRPCQAKPPWPMRLLNGASRNSARSHSSFGSPARGRNTGSRLPRPRRSKRARPAPYCGSTTAQIWLFSSTSWSAMLTTLRRAPISGRSETGFVGGQERHQIRHVLRLASAFERLVFQHPIAVFLEFVAEHALLGLGNDGPGA